MSKKNSKNKNHGYTLEQEKYILERVESAKKKGLPIRDVLSLIADEMGKSFGTIQTKYYNLKKELNETSDEQLKFETADADTKPDYEEVIEYVKNDVQHTQDMYQRIKSIEIEKENSIYAKSLVDKLEKVIGEKIEMKIERDHYQRLYEELREKYDQFRKLLEGTK
jgi:hypothetical protein